MPRAAAAGTERHLSNMPWKTTLKRARKDRSEGKAPTTQAGEFVKEEMEHVKRGKHGVKSRKQAIAIGLSKARRAGVKLAARKTSSGGSRAGGSRSSASRSSSKTSGAARGGTRKGGARKASARRGA
jgi:hypothetical protein